MNRADPALPWWRRLDVWYVAALAGNLAAQVVIAEFELAHDAWTQPEVALGMAERFHVKPEAGDES